jgi:hypothetical protein
MDKQVFPDKKDNLCIGSYNITSSFISDPKDRDDAKIKMPQHTWSNRRKYLKEAIDLAKIDVLALQELSPMQALDSVTAFPDYRFYFFALAETKEVKAGSIYSTADEIKEHLLGKDIGTFLIGIMYDPKKVTAKATGLFWYNPKPFEPPTATDRSLTDKGFGNMNTPRGPGWVHFVHNYSGKEFFVFTSHAPISGGWKARYECFSLENKIIPDIVGARPFFSVGDRNLFPGVGYDDTYNALVPQGVYDWLNKDSHIGYLCNWIGYLYEKEEFQNKINSGGQFTSPDRLDIGTSSLKSVWSAHYHCIIRGNSVELLGKLSEDDNLTRNFLSITLC